MKPKKSAKPALTPMEATPVPVTFAEGNQRFLALILRQYRAGAVAPGQYLVPRQYHMARAQVVHEALPKTCPLMSADKEQFLGEMLRRYSADELTLDQYLVGRTQILAEANAAPNLSPDKVRCLESLLWRMFARYAEGRKRSLAESNLPQGNHRGEAGVLGDLVANRTRPVYRRTHEDIGSTGTAAGPPRRQTPAA